MSDKIIQITEENLRKAVESGDLKQLAPEVFEKKKVRVQIDISCWQQEDGRTGVYPVGGITTKGVLNSWYDLITKPPMLMTLEWEE